MTLHDTKTIDKDIKNQQETCSITSGAIQQGVPTNVCRTFSLDVSFPVASQAATPKSAIITVPSSHRRMLPAFISLDKIIVGTTYKMQVRKGLNLLEAYQIIEVITVLHLDLRFLLEAF